jgi:hypothetical protein
MIRLILKATNQAFLLREDLILSVTEGTDCRLVWINHEDKTVYEVIDTMDEIWDLLEQ